jgi:hypothetical protein
MISSAGDSPRFAFALRGCHRSIVVVALVMQVGCESSRTDEFHLSGRVTFDGAPVPSGYILFNPDLRAGTDGLQGYTEIENGRYDTSVSQKGVSGGHYVAQIHGFVMDPHPKRLFQPYDQRVELSGSSNTVDFEVPVSAGVMDAQPLPPPT